MFIKRAIILALMCLPLFGISQVQQPGVMVNEVPAWPPVVTEVPTAVPVFMGYTEKAVMMMNGDLLFTAHKIHSLVEYEQFYGRDFAQPFGTVHLDAKGNVLSVDAYMLRFNLYYSLRQYFDNGGGDVYIISTGNYYALPQKADFIRALDVAKAVDEITLLAFPDAANLPGNDLYDVQQKALQQAGELEDRFCVFDLKYAGDMSAHSNVVSEFRNGVGVNQLKFGAAYTPWLKTGYSPVSVSYARWKNSLMSGTNPVKLSQLTSDPGQQEIIAKLENTKPADPGYAKLEDQLMQGFPAMKKIEDALRQVPIVLPPSGAVCGVYAKTDRDRGVWKAPANVSLNNVKDVAVQLSNGNQDDLNVDPNTGKSINAIRPFTGKGILVWGARTLLGNDNEWRYVAVRRFFNTVEESLKKSAAFAVFEPNNATTWAKLRGMISSYLTLQWRNGALMGSNVSQAYFVHVGLGQTMTQQDITEGRIIVEVGMAVTRPAEFIIFRFNIRMAGN